jgi:hypothetical protein
LRSFTDLNALIGQVPAQVVTRLSAVDFGRGSEALYAQDYLFQHDWRPLNPA